MRRRFSRTILVLLLGLLIFAIVYWLIPIPGQILLAPDNWQQINAWPRVQLETEDIQPGQEASLVIYDTTPWSHVKLVVERGEGTLLGHEVNSSTGIHQWDWSYIVPDTNSYRLEFYHDCDTGCQAWLTTSAGEVIALDNGPASSERVPTKLGVVFANPERDWLDRRGWNVELTYTQLAEADYWGIDDLARRVEAAADKGLLVLVRVDYDQGQSIPPPSDYLALDAYLTYIRRLVRDDRLKDTYGYIIGSGFNTRGNNSQASDDMVTPAWYAQVFNGYNALPEHTDNVVQTIRSENPNARILVGPVTPWSTDQDGALTHQVDAPWLNYFNTLTAMIDQASEEKAAAGIAQAAPDGFAVQSPGRPDAPELDDSARANEPGIDLRRPSWNGAQAGYRVYQDWLDVINTYPYTGGLPVYITSTNTFQPDIGVGPAQNYPPGWLTTALEVANQEPQIAAVCWYLDVFPHDDQWDFFSLTNPRGLMVDASNEFDQLLQNSSGE